MFTCVRRRSDRRLEERKRGVIRPLVLIGVILAAGPAFGQDSLPSSFYGDWQGEELTVEDGSNGLEVTAEDLGVRIESDGSGFRMHWRALSRERAGGALTRREVEARFEPAGRPGVFAFDPGQSSLLLRLFGNPSTNNPLEGEPLLWARLDGETLSVYGLAINAEGGFDLYQHVRTLTGEGMTARHIHRTEREAVTLDGRLVRAGG
jgi:hypothetical protein